MLFVPMTLREKTQNRVLGRSAGVPCEVASGFRSLKSNLNLKSAAKLLWISHPSTCDGWNRCPQSIPQRCIQTCNAPVLLQVMEATQEGGEEEELAPLGAGPSRTACPFEGVAIQKGEFYKVIERDF